jgi:outer membrane assembly lipoprotein YfiO
LSHLSSGGEGRLRHFNQAPWFHQLLEAPLRLSLPTRALILGAFAASVLATPLLAAAQGKAAPRPVASQATDPEFAKLVKEWTTKPEFISPLVDFLPLKKGIPTPKDVLGRYVGQPNRLTTTTEAYAYYRAGKAPEAIASAERYVALHPGTKEAPLAHHIIASAYFDDIKGPNRDQGATRKALDQLKTLKTRYPDSEYARDADQRIRVAEDNLSASEMEVGRYYLKDKNYVAAINRFKTVVSEYQTTAHVEEALMRLTECYMALGITKEAQNAAAVLGHNFPDSRWYKDAYALLKSDGLAPREDDDSWLKKAWKSVPKLSLGSG